jgi:hypothetical protein
LASLVAPEGQNKTTNDPRSRRPIQRRIVWIGLGVLAYLLHLVLGRDSYLVEACYSRVFFPALRWIWDYSIGLLPVPIVYVFLGGALAWDARYLYRRFIRKPNPQRPKKGRVGLAFLSVAAVLGAVVSSFYLMWGFNYNRVSLEKQLGLEVKPLGPAELRAEAERALRSASEARASISGATPSPLDSSHYPFNPESTIRNSMSAVLEGFAYPAPGRVRVRLLRPGGLLMRFSSSGFYFPFFGEGYISAGLLPFERPFTLAHEMAHGFGFNDEGVANFLAFLACDQAENQAVKYSGRLAYWNSVAGELFRISPQDLRNLLVDMPAGMRADLRAAAENWDRYRGSLMEIGEKINQQYLRSQGVKEGLKSYDRLAMLVVAWRDKEKKEILD